MSITLDEPSKATFIKVLKDPSVPLEERRVYNTAVISCGVAYSLPLPPARVALPSDHYDQNFAKEVSEFISALNEQVIIDVAATADITKQIWLNRYTVCFIPSVEQAVDLAVQVLKGAKPYEIGGNVAGEALAATASTELQAGTEGDANTPPSVEQGGQLSLESYIAKHVDDFSQTVAFCLKRK